MSRYTAYDRTSANYDDTRTPVGVAIIAGCLAEGAARPEQMKVLDAGCGTGSYTAALLPHVGSVHGVDRSRGMLDQAERKLDHAIAAGRVSLTRASIERLPFADAAFDGIMVNQVLHHLDDGDDGFPELRRVLAELARVLAPGGVLVVQSSSPAQLRDGFWFYKLIPRAATAIGRRLAPFELLRDELGKHGVGYRERIVPVDAVLQGPAYFDGRGPLGRAWRDGDSVWELASDDELEATAKQLRALDGDGELDAFVARLDAGRHDLGQVTFLAFAKEEDR